MGGQINRERERQRDKEVLPRKHSLSYLRNLKSLLMLRIFYTCPSREREREKKRERDYMGLNGTINEGELDLQMAEERDMSGRELIDTSNGLV